MKAFCQTDCRRHAIAEFAYQSVAVVEEDIGSQLQELLSMLESPCSQSHALLARLLWWLQGSSNGLVEDVNLGGADCIRVVLGIPFVVDLLLAGEQRR